MISLILASAKSFLLPFVQANWKYFALALVIASVYFYWSHRTHKIESLEHDKQELITHMASLKATYESNIGELKAAIKTQNDAIDALGKAKAEVETRLSTKVADIDKKNTELKKDLADKKKKIDALGPMSCQEMIDLFVDLSIKQRGETK